MIEPEYSTGQWRALEDQSARFRREIPGAGMSKRPISLESFEIDRAHSPRNSVQLRIVPGDRERNCGVEQGVEIISTMRVLPEVIEIDQHESSYCLLKSG